MASDIESYLKELRTAFAGADPAMIQDALFDAEEHLQAETAAGATFAEIVEHYGSPPEVAAAYLGVEPQSETAPAPVAPPPPAPSAPQPPADLGLPVGPAQPGLGGPGLGGPGPGGPGPGGPGPGGPGPDAPPAEGYGAQPGWAPGPGFGPGPAPGPGYPPPQTTPPPLPAGVQAGMAAAAQGQIGAESALRKVFGVFVDPAVYKALIYMILSLATGVFYFTVVVTGLSTAGGMLVLIIGLPLLLLVLGIVRGLALFEGRVVELLLGTRMPRRPRAEPPNAGFLQRMGFWIKDGRTWASMAYMLLMLPLGIAYFTIAITGLALGLSLIAAPFWVWLGEYSVVVDGTAYHWWFPFWGAPIAMVVGFLVLLGLLHAVRWIGRGHAAFAKALLVRLGK